MDSTDNKYKNVRSLERGLNILQELNLKGRATPQTLAKATKINRTTTYRLLETLENMGLVAKSPSDGQYVLLSAVRHLSEGFTVTDQSSRIVAEELMVMAPKVKWPTDFAVFRNGSMVIHETTHSYSPYSVHRSMIGRERPLLNSSLGRAVLATVSEQERTELINQAIASGALNIRQDMLESTIAHLRKDYAIRGYAWSSGGTDARINAIALPLRSKKYMYGAINVLYFKSAMSIETAAEQYLDTLRHTINVISKRLEKMEGQDTIFDA